MTITEESNETGNGKVFSPVKAEQISLLLMDLICGPGYSRKDQEDDHLGMSCSDRDIRFDPLNQHDRSTRQSIALLFTDENAQPVSFPVRSPAALAEAAEQFKQKIVAHPDAEFYGVLRLAYATFYTDEERFRYALPVMAELPRFKSVFSDNLSDLIESWGKVERGTPTAKLLLEAYRARDIPHSTRDFLDEEDALRLDKSDNESALLYILGQSVNYPALSPYELDPKSESGAKYSQNMKRLKRYLDFQFQDVPVNERASGLLRLGNTVLERIKSDADEKLSKNQQKISQGEKPFYHEEVVRGNLRGKINDIGESIMVSAMAIDLPEDGKKQAYDYISALPNYAHDVAPLEDIRDKLDFYELLYYSKKYLQPHELSSGDYEAYAQLITSGSRYPTYTQAMLYEMAQSCLPEGENTQRALDDSIAALKAYADRCLLKPNSKDEFKIFSESGYDGQEGCLDRQMRVMTKFVKSYSFSEGERLKFLSAIGSRMIELHITHPEISFYAGFMELDDSFRVLCPEQGSTQFRLEFIKAITAAPFVRPGATRHANPNACVVGFVARHLETVMKEASSPKIVETPHIAAGLVPQTRMKDKQRPKLVTVFKPAAVIGGEKALVSFGEDYGYSEPMDIDSASQDPDYSYFSSKPLEKLLALGR